MLPRNIRRFVGQFARTFRPFGAQSFWRTRLAKGADFRLPAIQPKDYPHEWLAPVQQQAAGLDSHLPAFLREDHPLQWLMTFQEKAALVQLLDFVVPPVALEIGTNRGGSLQVIAPRAGCAYALDYNPRVPEWLGASLPNVTFRIGDSRALLPGLMRELEAKREELGFVLIDGDHTCEGVRQDINAVLNYTPLRPLYVVMHDSFNPDVRAGILAANWQASPHAHYVQLDFVGGQLAPGPKGLEMWGGLGLALLLPKKRTGGLTIRQAGQTMFNIVRHFSSHVMAAA